MFALLAVRDMKCLRMSRFFTAPAPPAVGAAPSNPTWKNCAWNRDRYWVILQCGMPGSGHQCGMMEGGSINEECQGAESGGEEQGSDCERVEERRSGGKRERSGPMEAKWRMVGKQLRPVSLWTGKERYFFAPLGWRRMPLPTRDSPITQREDLMPS